MSNGGAVSGLNSNLNDQQFANVSDLHGMYSGDYDVPMSRVRGEISRGFNEGDPHPGDAQHGGVDQYINHLSDHIRQNGIKDPITVRGGNVVIDGHHRYLAAVQAGVTKIPVRHVN